MFVALSYSGNDQRADFISPAAHLSSLIGTLSVDTFVRRNPMLAPGTRGRLVPTLWLAVDAATDASRRKHAYIIRRRK